MRSNRLVIGKDHNEPKNWFHFLKKRKHTDYVIVIVIDSTVVDLQNPLLRTKQYS